jgi:hypothetical protein
MNENAIALLARQSASAPRLENGNLEGFILEKGIKNRSI